MFIKDENQKILKIKKIRDGFISFLNSIVSSRNKQIEEIIRKEDEKKINNILNNLK